MHSQLLLALTSTLLLAAPLARAQSSAGYALDFDGVDDHVSVPLVSPPASNYTIVAWVYPRTGGTSGGNRVAVLSSATCGGTIELLIHASTANPADPQYLELGRCGSFTGFLSTNPVPLNAWTHVAVTVNATNFVSYFINGSQDRVGIVPPAFDFSLGSAIHLGENSAQRRFDGQLDEVQIWNRALAPSEIYGLWRSGSPAGTEPGLSASFRFDEGAGTTAADSAPADGLASGTLVNGPQWVPSGVPLVPPAVVAHVGNYTDLGAGWRTASPVKPLDLDGDNIVGTDGYQLINLPPALPAYLASASILSGTYPGNGDYSYLDDPTSPGDQFLTGTMNPYPGPSVSADLFSFTLNAGAVGRTIRVGLLVDNLDGADWNADSLTLVQTNGTFASSGPVATVATALNNRIPDWIFFDISGAQAGDAFVIRGVGGVNSTATLGGVAFDSIGPVGGHVATSPLGFAFPYPSRLTVPALPGTNYKLTLTVSNLACPWQGTSFLLVGPGGQKVRPMSFAFGTFDNANGPTVLTFDDFAPNPLPVLGEGSIPSGTYRPDSDQSWPDFAAPAPFGPYSGTLASAATSQVAGVWSLYVAGNSVSLSSWSLKLTPITAPVVLTGTAADVTNYSATLSGSVNPGNLPTTAWFEYGLGTNFGTLTPPQALPASNATVALTALLTNLPGGTFSYRMVASNNLGVTHGSAQTFSFAGFSQDPVTPRWYVHGSIAWGDYDNDGRQDFISAGNLGGEGIAEIWRNTGNGFANVTTTVAPGLPGVGHGTAAWGDYDNDGRLDILIAGRTGLFYLEGPPITQVWRNTGSGFTNVPIPGLPGISGSATWGDFDNDGRLDFVLVGLTASSSSIVQFWRNTGSGFSPVVGNVSNPSQIVEVGERTRVIVGDFDRNGWLDFFAAGNTSTRFWFNNGGVFTINPGGGSFLRGFFDGAVPTGDYDNDGWLDLLYSGDGLSTNAAANTNFTFILRNQGTPLVPQKFSPISPPVFAGYGYAAAAWGDSDNDGRLDLLIAGRTNNNTGELGVQLLRNTGAGFADVTSSQMPGLPPSHSGSIAWCDYDNDGRLDFFYTGYPLASAQLWRNHTPVANTPPSAPAGLTATPATNGIMLTWAAASDAQTPAATLSYNVRIGSRPGGGDILSPASDANGWRRVTALGNAQIRTNFLITRLLPGTYYWSVQAVDNGFAGGPFAAEASFTIAPRLNLVAAGTNVVLSWSASAPEWVLQQSPSLSASNWVNAPSGTNNPATIPATLPARFYRVFKP